MPPRSTREKLLPLLLAGALLLCHGAFGWLHQVHEAPISAHLAVEHASHQMGHGSADSHPPVASDYAAAFFALLFGLVYALLRRAGRARPAVPAPRLTGQLLPATIPHLPRSPTPSLLQVLRL